MKWVLSLIMVSSMATVQGNGENTWVISDPILLPGPQGSFDEVAVKDPSIVFFEGMWHVFYTARSQQEYTTGYVCADTLAGLNSAPRHALPMIRGSNRYGCAPQVFIYEPQQLWYLVFQNRDSNYQPMYSTTRTISRPDTWAPSRPLIQKDERAKWIDFWVICDNTRAYLFYTQAHRDVMVRSTSLDAFPHGWGRAHRALEAVHEAVHIYRVKNRREFHMVYELNTAGVRSFGLAVASDLVGPWTRRTERYAAADQLEYVRKVDPWTDMVSHGEVIRTGCNHLMAYEPEGCAWLIQGLLKEDSNVPYPSLPWSLGIMTLKVD